jgi:polysaccharide deacetylase family protein (PEP-CTERM system associated)
MESLLESNEPLSESAAAPGEGEPVIAPQARPPAPIVLSFDVEEHYRIEAASGLVVDSRMQVEYRERMRRVTEWILERLSTWRITATFFLVGQISETNPALVRSIHDAGHEVASHGWDHRRIHVMTPQEFREDLRRSKDALEQATGACVVGYRAPTFSVVAEHSWALDVLAEMEFLYDSSIYPVHHDRYGVPGAPRNPFLARGPRREILEIPPATVRVAGVNLPVGGGGYFRLLPLPLMKLALSVSRRDPRCEATVLYFHPWEFDPDQPRLPLRRINRFRTYVGIKKSRARLAKLVSGHRFVRAVDLARELHGRKPTLPRFHLNA